MSSRRLWFVSLSIAGHIGIGFAIYASNTWGLERLGPGKGPAVSLGVFASTAPVGSESPNPKETVKNNPKRPKVTVTVQPTLAEETKREDVPGSGSGTGSGAGSGEGSGSGQTPVTGDCAMPPCDEPPEVVEQPKVELPKPKPPTRVSPHDFRTHRTYGREDIHPPEHVKRQMIADDRRKSTATFEVCVNEAGAVSKVRMLASTKYADYDNQLAGAVRSWRYQPFATNGQAVSVCSTVTFIYSIK